MTHIKVEIPDEYGEVLKRDAKAKNSDLSKEVRKMLLNKARRVIASRPGESSF